MNFFKVYSIVLLLSSITLSISRANTDQADLTIKKMILSVKPNSCYEETTEEFKKRIQDAVVFSDPATGMDYLLIRGDGTAGQRLFIYDRNKNILKLVQGGDTDEADSKIYKDVYQFDSKTKEFSLISTAKN